MHTQRHKITDFNTPLPLYLSWSHLTEPTYLTGAYVFSKFLPVQNSHLQVCSVKQSFQLCTKSNKL